MLQSFATATTTFAQGGYRCARYTVPSIQRAVVYITASGPILPRPIRIPLTRYTGCTRCNSTITTTPLPPRTPESLQKSPRPPPPPPHSQPNDPDLKDEQPPPPPPKPRRVLPILTTLLFLTTGAYILFLPILHRNPSPNPNSTPTSHSHASLHPQKFSPWILVAREPCADPTLGASARSAIFTFRPARKIEAGRGGDGGEWDFSEWWGKGVWSVEVKQPELMVSRRYTPLPPDVGAAEREGQGEDGGEKGGELRMLIKEEEGGEVSRWLFGLPVGKVVGFRGPRWEWIAPASWSRQGKEDRNLDREGGKAVVFLAGGTGIAPAIQVFRAIIECEAKSSTPPNTNTTTDTTTDTTTKPHTSYTILWATRTPSDLPPSILHELTHLSQLAAKFNISLTLTPHIDSQARFITQADIQAALTPPELPHHNHHHPNTSLYAPSWGEWIKGFFFLGSAGKEEKEKKKSNVYVMHDPRDKYIFVSGPEGFVSYFAGEKGEDGESQGRVGGVVKEVVRWGREMERKALEGMRSEKEGIGEKVEEEGERGVRRARWFVWKL